MEKTIYNDEYVGQTIGKYKILEVIGRDKFGTKIYKTQCIKCGEIIEKGMALSSIKRSDPNSMCNHEGVVNAANEDHVGKVYGKYKIIDCANKRDSCNTMLYYAQCIKCGYFLKTPRTIYSLAKTDPNSMCNHERSEEEKRSLEGTIIGKYKILDYLGGDGYGHAKYKVECIKCGFIVEKGMCISDIKRSDPNSICIHKNFWHSKSLQIIYNHMMSRCFNPKDEMYPYYGGKGITVCEEWKNASWRFNNWAIENGYREGLTLNRINPYLGYYPENCQFAELSDNCKYKTTTKLFSVNGVTDSLAAWERSLNLYNGAISQYLRTHTYEEAALHIAEIQNPGKIIPCVIVDREKFESTNNTDILSLKKISTKG